MNLVVVVFYFWLVQWCRVKSVIASTDEDCCINTTGSCRTLCQQVFSSPEIGPVHLQEECPLEMESFWNCVNQSTVLESPWSGRLCCNLSQFEKCEKSCQNANSVENIRSSCRRSDETELYDCITRQQVAEGCCVNTRNTNCYHACKQAFKNVAHPYEEIIENVITYCSETDPLVLQCVQNYTRKSTVVNLNKYSHCCNNSPNRLCKETCYKLLRTTGTVHRVISELQNGGCGNPLLHDKFWQCFLQKNNTRKDPAEISLIRDVGIDSAKLHCCYTATSGICKNLCIKTFSNEWSSTSDSFIRECLSFPSEEKLQYCLDEVEEPCELGCSGLSYCTNFNRPTELFRSCTPESDDAAKQDVELWQSQGFINVFGFQLPFRNITQCNPSAWKAFACILQIKPCQTNSPAIKICREDCEELLDQCLNWNKIPSGLTTSSFCSRFESSIANFKSCIPIKAFLQPPKPSFYEIDEQITTPCKDNPCEKQNVCLIDRECYTNRYRRCSEYQCIPGCRLGDISEYLVPIGTHVRLPLRTNNPKELCYKTCQCSADGLLAQCQQLPCIKNEDCYVTNTRIEHGSQFLTNCNLCSCYAGEITCTKKYCTYNHGLYPYEKSVKAATLPFNCLPHYIPVCGRNGKTYHNSCLARRVGLRSTDFTLGECSTKNVCEFNDCKEDEICIPDRRVCLSLLSKPCPQYKCVDFERSCGRYPDAPVCDEDNEEHRNLCYLLKKKKHLAYEGTCLKNCNKHDLVCGTDGNTYQSECVAYANYILVDYKGPCIAVGSIDEYPQPCSIQVECPPLVDSKCHRILPPGACCPVCAGAFRTLYSQKQLDRIIFDAEPTMTNVFTVKALLEALERHIRVADCVIRGHWTMESDIIIMVMPSKSKTLYIDTEICRKESEKLASMIQTGSPRIASELNLGILNTAALIPDLRSTSNIYASASFQLTSYCFITYFVPILLYFLF